MKIIDTITPGNPFVSLEFFPPKERTEWPAFFRTVERLTATHPLFASVTYGAGGSTHRDTLEIVSRLKREHGLETMAHLTCVGSECNEVERFLAALTQEGVTNVLALRGDLPKEVTPDTYPCLTLLHASDLVTFIRSSHPDLGMAVAGYPEMHPEAAGPDADLAFLKLKLDQGADFVVTQLFFDNRYYHDFVRRARAIGIDKPDNPRYPAGGEPQGDQPDHLPLRRHDPPGLYGRTGIGRPLRRRGSGADRSGWILPAVRRKSSWPRGARNPPLHPQPGRGGAGNRGRACRP